VTMVRRPLIGFDGSPPARAALRHAARAARRNPGRVTVVLVITQPWYAGLCPPVAIVPPACDLEQAAIDELRDAVEHLTKDISVVSLVRRGPVGRALAREAGHRCCDAIVIGSHRGVWSGLTGGVERYLRQHAHTPVIVVPVRPARHGSARRRGPGAGPAPAHIPAAVRPT
jgi:nucleotide-binding universal stress UspA family protein